MWSLLHLKTIIPSFIIFFFIALIIRKFLNSKSEKIKLIPLKIIAITIVLLEIGKQTVNFVQGYNLYAIPLHFCSLFIFMCPLAAFYTGQHKEQIRAVVANTCAALFLFMCVGPTIIYNKYAIQEFFQYFLSFHTVAFHGLVILYFFILISLDFVKLNWKRDIPNLLITYSIFCAISATFANVLGVNYTSFHHCVVEPLNNARLAIIRALGPNFGQFTYVLIVSSSTIVVTMIAYLFLNLVLYLKKKQVTK